jgi:excisionase family DNA binding protein
MQAMNRPYPVQPNFKAITMTRSQESDYYTVTQAAKVLEVSPSTIWRWIKAGKLPAYRVGERAIRIKKADLPSIVTPARAKEVSMEKQPTTLQPPSAEELARRKAVVDRVLQLRQQSNIAPLTTAALIQQVRSQERNPYDTNH